MSCDYEQNFRFFSKLCTYESKSDSYIVSPKIDSTHFGTGSVINTAAKPWNGIPLEIKQAYSVTVFK